MSRSQRLFELLQTLRGYRRPVSGATLASALGISIRTLYRDIETLKAQGAHIEGATGLGFVLRPGFMLPPLMFSELEIEALVLGSRWVAERADRDLATGAHRALAKIAAVLPPDLRPLLEGSGLLIGPAETVSAGDEDIKSIRRVIREERRMQLSYQDQDGKATSRIVWPFAMAYFEKVRVLVAWCELRQAYRHFRTDRITELKGLPTRYPRRRWQLLKEWRAIENIEAP